MQGGRGGQAGRGGAGAGAGGRVGRSNLSSLWGGQVAGGKSYSWKSYFAALFLHEGDAWGDF